MHATQGPLSSVSLNILLYKRRCSANHRRPICNVKHKSTVCEYQPTPQTLTRTRTDSVPVHTRTHTHRQSPSFFSAFPVKLSFLAFCRPFLSLLSPLPPVASRTLWCTRYSAHGLCRCSQPAPALPGTRCRRSSPPRPGLHTHRGTVQQDTLRRPRSCQHSAHHSPHGTRQCHTARTACSTLATAQHSPAGSSHLHSPQRTPRSCQTTSRRSPSGTSRRCRWGT